MRNTILTDAEINAIYSEQLTTVEFNTDDYTPSFLDSYDDLQNEFDLEVA